MAALSVCLVFERQAYGSGEACTCVTHHGSFYVVVRVVFWARASGRFYSRKVSIFVVYLHTSSPSWTSVCLSGCTNRDVKRKKAIALLRDERVCYYYSTVVYAGRGERKSLPAAAPVFGRVGTIFSPPGHE